MSTSGRSDLVDVAAELRHETEKAYLIDIGDGRKVWIPKAAVEAEHVKGSHYVFSMPERLAIDKGLV